MQTDTARRALAWITAVSGILALLVGFDAIHRSMVDDACVGCIAGILLLGFSVLYWQQ